MSNTFVDLNLEIKHLTADGEFFSFMKNSLSNNTINIWVDTLGESTIWNLYPSGGEIFNVDAQEMPQFRIDFINEVLTELDDILGLNFNYVNNKKEANLTILQHYEPVEGYGYGGTVSFMQTDEIMDYELVITTSTEEPLSSNWWKNMILHELAHALHLEHPFDNEDNDIYGDEIYPTKDYTVMAYGEPLNGIHLGWYHPIDIQALKTIWGIGATERDDSIIGLPGEDIINSLKGDDSITGDNGNDVIDGGEGVDTSVYSGKFSDYSFTRATSSLTVADQRTGANNGTDVLKNIEYIQFIDQTVEESKVDIVKTYSGKFSDYKFYNKGNGVYQIKTDSGYDDITGIPLLTFSGEAATSYFRDISAIVDIKGTFDQVTGLSTDSGRMFRLYNASFKRLPDPDGLAYWIDNFSSGRNSIRVVASSFLGSAEFAERYGSNVTDEKFVNTLYQNVLGRAADTEGLNYWVGNLSSGLETRYEALLGFAESAENKALFTDMTGLG